MIETSPSKWSLEDTYNAEYEVCTPRCSECDTELNTNDILNGAGKIKCPKCGDEDNVYTAPDWFTKFERYNLKPTKIISGVSPSGSDPEMKDIKPIAMRCISCSAALSITTETPRNCTCEHCGTVQYLPDPVWKALHPVKKREDWYIYYSS